MRKEYGDLIGNELSLICFRFFVIGRKNDVATPAIEDEMASLRYSPFTRTAKQFSNLSMLPFYHLAI